MPYHFHIVEDQPLIALDIEYTVCDLGHHFVGVARNTAEAMALGRYADIAFVDVNLTDGATGIEIGRRLALENDVEVIFMTSDSRVFEEDIDTAVGAIAKPVFGRELEETIKFAVEHLSTGDGNPPKRMKTFH